MSARGFCSYCKKQNSWEDAHVIHTDDIQYGYLCRLETKSCPVYLKTNKENECNLLQSQSISSGPVSAFSDHKGTINFVLQEISHFLSVEQ